MNRKAISKKFHQVKQKIGESTGYKEKTSIMDDDMSLVDRNLENIRTVICKTSKHLSNLIDSAYSGDNKKLHVNNRMILGQIISGFVNNFDNDTLLGSTLLLTGQAMMAMGGEIINFETSVQQNVLDCFNNILENDFKKVDRQKKKCSAARLDMDALKNRLTNLKKSNQQAPQHPEKILNVEKELEDMNKKFEIQKDLLTVEMLNLISKQKNISQVFLNIITNERDFHSNSLTILTALVEQLKEIIDSTVLVPVFGLELTQYKSIYNEDISYVLRDCFNSIKMYGGFQTEGIFRIASGSTKIQKLKALFNSNYGNIDTFHHDVHSFACVVKQYLRELPEPILTFKLVKEWKDIGLTESVAIRVPIIKQTLTKLPEENRNNLKYIFSFLKQLAACSDITKMTVNNLGIVMGPNILWDLDDSMALKTNQLISSVVETMITEFDQIFNDDGDAFTWSSKDLPDLTSPKHKNTISNEDSNFNIDDTVKEQLIKSSNVVSVFRKQRQSLKNTLSENLNEQTISTVVELNDKNPDDELSSDNIVNIPPPKPSLASPNLNLNMNICPPKRPPPPANTSDESIASNIPKESIISNIYKETTTSNTSK